MGRTANADASLARGAAAGADEVASLRYRGRPSTLIVTNPPGGGYDLLARRHRTPPAKQFPEAHAIVQNMPGAAGIAAPITCSISPPRTAP